MSETENNNKEEQSKEENNSESSGTSLFKSKRNLKNARQKDSSSSSTASSNTPSTLILKKQKPMSNPNFASTMSAEKLKEKQDKILLNYKATEEGEKKDDQKATASIETETEKEKDSRTVFEKKGGKNYGGGAGKIAKGPTRATTHIRISSRFDYQPDVCKDYLETGFCGYGDNCKFAHIREDYKSGWQQEQEFEEEQRQKKKRELAKLSGNKNDDEEPEEENDEDGLPFACFICRKPFTDPVVTKCKHYFCGKCAMDHSRKSGKCPVCQQPTHGIFNTAHEIIKKMENGSMNSKRKRQSNTNESNTNNKEKPNQEEGSVDISKDLGEDAPVIV